MDTNYDYDLKKFGQLSENIRLRNKLKKSTIREKYSINPDTIRKLELGITSPTHETLHRLSEAYNMDMIKIFESCKYSNHQTLNYIRQKIDCAAFEDRIEVLSNLMLDIKKIKEFDAISDKVSIEILQLEHLIDVVKLKNKTDKLSVESSEILSLKGIRLTKSNFSTRKLDNSVYSLIESRFLLSLALSQVRKKNYELAEKIIACVISNLSFQLKYDNSVVPLLIQAYYQKSNYLFQLNRNIEIIECCKFALDLALEHSFTKLVPYLYFRQGIAEFDLCLPGYMITLNRSLNFLESHDLHELKLTFKESLLNNYDIAL